MYLVLICKLFDYPMPTAPRAPRAAKIKATMATTSGTTNPDDSDDVASDGEPPAKRAKGKGKASGRTVVKPPVWKVIQKPPLHLEWSDMKDWNGRKDSPLMDLPVEVLDRIFCVRPELKVRLQQYKQ